MRTPPAQRSPGGADERLPVQRPASEPAPAGEALVEHLVDRLARAEQELRAARAGAESADAGRELIGQASRAVGGHEPPQLSALLRLALPLLGDWALIEEAGDGVERQVIAIDAPRQSEAAPLAGRFQHDDPSLLALPRVQRLGRAERLDELPKPPAEGPVLETRALEALGDGSAVVVPVHCRGTLVAGLMFGRASRDAAAYGTTDVRLAADLAALVGLAIDRRRAVAAAADAERAKAEFLTMMSHELRTPLNAIAGYAQLLEMGFRGPLNDDQREAVSRILRGQEHLLELVDAVLTFSRLTSGRILVDPIELSADSLLDVAVDPLRREFEARDVALEVVPCGHDVRILADHERAPQILRHLLSNALKFTAPGGHVRVGCACGPGVVRYEVADTGRGIPASQHEAIFQPFVQVEKGHTRSVDGSGLGLAIGRELAQRMGGSLGVTSEVGVGSRFVLTLPRAETAPVVPAVASMLSADDNVPSGRG